MIWAENRSESVLITNTHTPCSWGNFKVYIMRNWDKIITKFPGFTDVPIFGPMLLINSKVQVSMCHTQLGEFGGFNGNHEIILPPISHPHISATEQMLDKIVLFGSYVYRTFTMSKWFSIDNIFLIFCSRWSRQPILCSSPVSITCCIEWHVLHMAHDIQYHILHSYGLPCYILTSEQDDQHLADIFKCIFLIDNLSFLIFDFL